MQVLRLGGVTIPARGPPAWLLSYKPSVLVVESWSLHLYNESSPVQLLGLSEG